MKYFAFGILIFTLSLPNLSRANQIDQVTLTGHVRNIYARTFELKTDRATLIVPKVFLKSRALHPNELVALTLTKNEFNQISIYKIPVQTR